MMCIGEFGGGSGTWYAELDFDGSASADGEPTATILQRAGKDGAILVATVPLGRIMENGETLDPSDRVNQRLMQLVRARVAWETIGRLRDTIQGRLRAINYAGKGELTEAEAQWADAESDMLDELERVMGLLDVPGE